jgi:hypothetical protein
VYDVTGRDIVEYSSMKLPEVLTAPEYVISTADRTDLVLRCTIQETPRRHRHPKKKHNRKQDDVMYGAILFGKDESLPDGTYVFRIDGALSSKHTHRDTKWEFCGLRGTSAEELTFTMNDGKCRAIEKKSRWELSGTLNLVDFSGLLTIYFDDLTTLQALGDVSYNEVFLNELESSLLAGTSSVNDWVLGVSVQAFHLDDSQLNVNFGLRINTAQIQAETVLTQDHGHYKASGTFVFSYFYQQSIGGATQIPRVRDCIRCNL